MIGVDGRTVRGGKRARSIVGDDHDGGRALNDFYPTPRGATLAILGVESFPREVWEPACGDGAISRVLEEHGHVVISSDLVDRGYGVGGVDFLRTVKAEAPAIVTNPPFRLAESFVAHAKRLGVEKLVMLLKLAFLEGQSRSALLESTKLSRVWVFRNRITLTRNGEPLRNSGMIAFAWFVWEVGHEGPPRLGWVSEVKEAPSAQLSMLEMVDA